MNVFATDSQKPVEYPRQIKDCIKKKKKNKKKKQDHTVTKDKGLLVGGLLSILSAN